MKYFILLLISSICVFAQTDYTLNPMSSISSKDFTIYPTVDFLKISILHETFEIRRSVSTKVNSPFVKVKITLPDDSYSTQVNYDDKTYYPVENAKENAIIFFIDLLASNKFEIQEGNSSQSFSIFYQGPKTQIIDSSCLRYQLKTSSHNSLSSIGCELSSNGRFGNEKNTLKINIQSKEIGKHGQAFKESYNLYSPGVMSTKAMKIHAYFPEDHNRLKTAIGFGPYTFDTKYPKSNESIKSTSRPIAPALMIYANLEIDQTNSIRLFNATVQKDAFFNNAGIYYANDIVTFMNDKFTLTTLLGFQHLHFKEGNNSKSFSQVIFPQGLEFLYTQAFGIKNFLVSGGGFVSPDPNIDYENFWVRFGKSYYWELNYIYWSDNEASARMWGLSLIFPSLKFL